MSEPIVSIDEIRRHARTAAERGEPPGTCPYERTSAHGKQWLAAYWERELELSGEATA